MRLCHLGALSYAPSRMCYSVTSMTRPHVEKCACMYTNAVQVYVWVCVQGSPGLMLLPVPVINCRRVARGSPYQLADGIAHRTQASLVRISLLSRSYRTVHGVNIQHLFLFSFVDLSLICDSLCVLPRIS